MLHVFRKVKFLASVISSKCFIFGIHVYIQYSSGFTNALKESASMWAFITLRGKPRLKWSSNLLVSGFWLGSTKDTLFWHSDMSTQIKFQPKPLRKKKIKNPALIKSNVFFTRKLSCNIYLYWLESWMKYNYNLFWILISSGSTKCLITI